MTELAETLWKEFAIETEEHLDLIEPLLVSAETGELVAADVAQLFRSFHSVKGLSRSMDMLGMEAVAHRAESLLGLVRDGAAGMDCAITGLLLEAVDALRSLRIVAVTERRAAPAAEDLLARLNEAFEARRAGPAPARPEAPPPPVPAVPEPKPEAAETASLADDPEMVQIFVELLGEHLPALAQIATAELDRAEVRQGTEEALDTLIHAAGVMGFEGMAGSFDALRRLIAGPDEPEADSDDREKDGTASDRRQEALRHLATIRTGLAALCPSVDIEGGDSGLGTRLQAALHGEVTALMQALAEVLHRFEAGTGTDSDQALAEEFAALCRSLYTFFVFTDCPRAGGMMLMLEDVFSRAAGGEIVMHAEVLKLADDAVAAVRGAAATLSRSTDLDKDATRDLLRRFREALLIAAQDGVDGTDPVSALRRVLADYEIRPELVEILSPENIRELIEAARHGREQLYEILAHLESSEALTMAFVTWVQRETRPITNRTIFVDGKSWFEFLVASDLPGDVIAEHITALDPGGQLIKVRSCAVRADAPAPVVPAAAPPGAGRTGTPRPAATAAGKGSNVLRVRGETIDQLMTQMGEMVTIGNMLRVAAGDDAARNALQALGHLVERLPEAREAAAHLAAIEAALERVRRIDQQLGATLGRLQENTLELRVVPIDVVFSRFPRVVRDMAQAKGTPVRLDLEGSEVRIDKGMVEALADPLMHMVRNAVDHGVEGPEERPATGKPAVARLSLKAVSRSNRVVIEIADDGRGLDAEKIRRKAVTRGLIGEAESRLLSPVELYRFIFAPGFSTVEQVTETSGRGVGMDVVQTNVTRLGGTIEVASQLGQGTTFTLHLPLSVAIQSVLLVEAQGQILAIPERFLAEIHEAAPEACQRVRGQNAILLRDNYLPVFRLAELLGRAGPEAGAGARPIVVLTNGRHRIGLEVDHLHRRQELFIKEIHPRLAAIPGVGGASVSGDGRVVLILDGDDLFRLAERGGGRPSP